MSQLSQMCASVLKLDNSRFPLLRILNITTSMLFGRVMEVSIEYPQSIMVVVFSKDNKGNGLLEAVVSPSDSCVTLN